MENLQALKIDTWEYKHVNISTYYNYQGLLFTNRLCWCEGINILVDEATKTLVSVKQVHYTLKKISVIFKIVDAHIKPILLYTCEGVWDIEIYQAVYTVIQL